MKALEIKNLVKVYGTGTKAVNDISFTVEPGEFFGLLGPNGAGKSTTIGIISHLVNKTSGTVKIFGKDITNDSEAAKRFIGLVPQEFNFDQFENPEFILVNQAGYFGIPRKEAKARAEKLLKQLDLWEKKDVKSRLLSGGMKRKLMIARALLHEPKLLILDEPSAGVDVETRRELWDFIIDLNKKGTTILLTTHYLEEAEQLCKRLAIIDKGNIVRNTSIKELLLLLNQETFVLDTEKKLSSLKPLKGYPARLIDETTIEVDIKKEQNINDYMSHLTKENINIISMRNKVNRLEELFIELTKKAPHIDETKSAKKIGDKNGR